MALIVFNGLPYKTLIVEKALELALEDYEKHGTQSKLFKAME